MKNLSMLILLLCMGIACSKIEENSSGIQKKPIEVDEKIRNTTSYNVLPNPYTLANMQAVYDSLSISRVTLQPTDYYVRFLPQDSLQLHNLMYGYNLELFSYPLDMEIEEGEVYEDPTIPEGSFGWYYTTVKPNFVFPSNITCEILDRCYIPTDYETIPNTRSSGLLNLENAAFEKLGYILEPKTRAGEKQTGRIRVFDHSLDPKQYVPVQGVKIRCHTLIKWATAYTDENGNYTMNGNFSIDPLYAIVFDNKKGFDIWDGWIHIQKATYLMGFHSKHGYSKDIPAGGKEWRWAAVNNAGYEYYKMCEATGITKPPSNLKIWVLNDIESSAAAMLSHLNHTVAFNGNSFWINLLVNSTGGVIVNTLLPLFHDLLLDIAVGTKDRSYKRIYTATQHELSHASHFCEVGGDFWAKYVSYIITYGSYGDGKGKNAEICGIGEMWGYAMEHIYECEKYYPHRLDSLYSANWNNPNWFKPEIYWDLYRNNILTKKQIFDCLSRDVDTYDKLVDKMHTLYPDQAHVIDTTFNFYGIVPKTNKRSRQDSNL